MHALGISPVAEDRLWHTVGCRPVRPARHRRLPDVSAEPLGSRRSTGIAARVGVACLLLWTAASLAARLRAQDTATAPAQPQAFVFASNSPQSGVKPVSLAERADIFMARKSYADAIDYYHRALKRDAGNAVLWNKLGIAYQLEMDYRDARKSYKESTHKLSDFAEPWNNLGTTYYLEGKYRKSLKYYTHAVKLGPTAASFHMNLGAAYSQMKRFPQAIEQYRAALEIDPNVLNEHSSGAAVVQARGADVEFYFYLAKVFASLARPEDSVRFLRRALEDGFKDLKRLDDDPDFQKISKYPAYVELRKNPPVAIPD